jgi:hypothetical protein
MVSPVFLRNSSDLLVMGIGIRSLKRKESDMIPTTVAADLPKTVFNLLWPMNIDESLKPNALHAPSLRGGFSTEKSTWW